MKIHGVCFYNFVCNLIMISPVQSNRCSTDCRTCSNDGVVQMCTSCDDGYWLLNSSCQACSNNNCATCSNGSSCSTCKPGFYSTTSFCISQCQNNCLGGLCDENTGHCTECPSDRYGYHCDLDCKLCKNEQCDLRQCTDGCKSGYWQYQNENYTECRPCLDNCSSCVNSSICNVCEDGTYLSAHSETRNYCVLCPSTCEKCSIINSCSVCKTGYYGTACEFACSAKIADCLICEWDGAFTVTCSQCDNGWALQDNTCQKVPHQCIINCEICAGNNECEICKTGWVGALCDETCHNSPHCVACHETDGSIVCNECVEGYAVMNGECNTTSTSTNTIQSPSTPSTPESTAKKTTYLTTPTMIPTKTSIAQQTLTASTPASTKKTTVLPTLTMHTSKSTKASIAQKTLTASTPATTKKTTVLPALTMPITKSTKTLIAEHTLTTISGSKQTSDQGGNNTMLFGAIAGGAGLLLIIAVLLTVYFIKRRKTNTRHAINQQCMEEDLTDYAVYAKPNKVKTKQQTEDYVYAQPNKHKRNSRQTTDDIEESVPPSNNHIAISLDLEAAMAETDVDEEQLETLEGEYTSEIEMELPKGLQRSCNEALKTHNRKKNRFNGIYAYDATRVVLGSESYINANYIDGHNQSNAYIASLGPTADTMNKFTTFWEMIWEEEVEAIVMLTNLEERGKMKCEQYWPDPGTPRTCLDYIVKCEAENVFAEFAVRELTLERDGRDGLFVAFFSAGIGRTGTYIALDLLINEGRDCNYVDMFGCALGLRGQRVNLIQNEALKALPVPSKRLSLWTLNYADRTENRAEADVPCDNHRVRLLSSKNDYINAVYVNGYQQNNAYIAAQTPMPSTVDDFISMVCTEQCPCIVSLDEENSALSSVALYLPALNETSIFGQYQIRCNDINTCDDYVVKDVVIFKSPSDQLKLQHYQLRKWKADDVVPSSTEAFLHLVTDVNTAVKNHQFNGPVLLHCVTGSQRCGVFCAVSTMMEKLAIERQMSGIHTICHIRSRRNTALLKQEMFTFCYQCVADFINSSSDSDNYYSVLAFKQ